MNTKKIEDFIINFFSDKNEKKVMLVKWTALAILATIYVVANILK